MSPCRRVQSSTRSPGSCRSRAADRFPRRVLPATHAAAATHERRCRVRRPREIRESSPHENPQRVIPGAFPLPTIGSAKTPTPGNSWRSLEVEDSYAVAGNHDLGVWEPSSMKTMRIVVGGLLVAALIGCESSTAAAPAAIPSPPDAGTVL